MLDMTLENQICNEHRRFNHLPLVSREELEWINCERDCAASEDCPMNPDERDKDLVRYDKKQNPA